MLSSLSHEAVKYVRVCTLLCHSNVSEYILLHIVRTGSRGQHRELGCALLSEPMPTIARYVCIAKDECGCSSIIYFCSELHFYCCKGMYLPCACCATFLFRSHAQECCTSWLYCRNSANINWVLSSFIQNILSNTPIVPDSNLARLHFIFVSDAGHRSPFHALCPSSCSSFITSPVHVSMLSSWQAMLISTLILSFAPRLIWSQSTPPPQCNDPNYSKRHNGGK